LSLSPEAALGEASEVETVAAAGTEVLIVSVAPTVKTFSWGGNWSPAVARTGKTGDVAGVSEVISLVEAVGGNEEELHLESAVDSGAGAGAGAGVGGSQRDINI
jgi:hypothetical protein